MTAPLHLGTAKKDITPLAAVPLAGFTHRNGTFENIAHRLFAKIWLFQQSDLGGTLRRAALIQADLIWWGSDRMPELRKMLSERWGLGESSVIFHATHTHSGPQTSSRFTPSLGKPDPAYIQYLEDRVAEGLEVAFRQLEPISIEHGTGRCDLGVHRRKLVGGAVVMEPNEDGPVDRELHVFRFRASDGATKGIMAHYTCHPTTTDDNFVSSEFPGVAMELIESGLGQGAIASFLQGCCGDIRPALVRDGSFYRGHDEDVRRLGRQLYAEVLRVLEGEMKPAAPCSLRSSRTVVPLPFRELPGRDQLGRTLQTPGVMGQWSRLLLSEPARLQRTVPFEITLLVLADGVSFLAMNGEVVVEYGLYIKRQSQGRTLPLPYSNGMIGYIPTAGQAAEGGYEGAESAYYFGLPGAFDASLESAIRDAISELLQEGECRRNDDGRTQQSIGIRTAPS